MEVIIRLFDGQFTNDLIPKIINSLISDITNQ